MKEIVIATRNPKKLKEIKRLFKKTGIKTLSLINFPKTPEVIEDKKTFRGNAAKKAVLTSRYTKILPLADDSGLEVKALGNKPGVKSSRYAGPKKRDIDNNLKLLKALKGKPASKRKAQFQCVIAIAYRGKLIKIANGICKGKIAFRMEGRTGFGYDPVFIPTGCKKSFSQLGSKIKDRLSHRSKALRKAKTFIQGYL